MKRLIITAFALLLVACSSTPANRISANQAAYDAYPADVQAAIQAGEIKPGFTLEQVEMAWGKADRVSREVYEGGERIVWGYTSHKPQVGIGFGVGTGGGSTRTSTGIGISSGGQAEYVKMAVIENDRVVDVRYFE
ncbi:hypothetical protein [Umboniibacter marinipuniceus]|uniref:Lipoprotein n=1 Tax=Umboniibacter marinipuniceus TaxID=569599 RepID=A0A3L9ZY21_9GAMM|nr:hypothetical protein [Umboniibacter marinipuniceus]RMA77613.1 hypothetical protein DFR27_2432 [Umboniibacter marinipuniceus]